MHEKAKSVCFIYMQMQKSEIQICSNKHETGLVVTWLDLTVPMRRMMCLFVISIFQTSFSHEMTVVSEIYCQQLNDKTSIFSLRQIIKMSYCHIHGHVHV